MSVLVTVTQKANLSLTPLTTPSKDTGHFLHLEKSQASRNPQGSDLFPKKVWGLEKIRL